MPATVTQANFPHNVSPSAFDRFLKASAAAVGSQWVKTAFDEVEPYGRTTTPFDDDLHMAAKAKNGAKLVALIKKEFSAAVDRNGVLSLATGARVTKVEEPKWDE